MNKHSDQLGELFSALAKAQAQIKTAVKDSTNPFFKSQYTSLDGCWDACRGPLSVNGLSIIQTLHEEGARIYLCTILGHSSGQYIESTMPLLITKTDPQSLGSAITYARRYTLCAIVGLTQGDDDGEAAMKGAREGQSTISQVTSAPKKISVEDFVDQLAEQADDEHHYIGMTQYLEKLFNEKHVPIPKIMEQALRPGMVERFISGWKKWYEGTHSEDEVR